MSRLIHLTAAGVSLVLLAEDEHLPEVIHWGAALGDTDPATLAALALADRYPVTPSSVDALPRYTVLLEGRYGWLGKPGLIGSGPGQSWTPGWRVTRIGLDGSGIGAGAVSGPGAVDVVAEADGLGLHLTLELTSHGLVRTQATVTNRAAGEYALGELTVGLPVPPDATELLDFSGRWAGERFPQRTVLGVGQHRREGRRGRTGADAAYVLHAGRAGFGFRSGEVWSVHTAWSGNHVHLAERDSNGFQALSGGELLLAGEVRLGEGESYTTPWVYFNYGDGLDEQADRFHAHLRALPHAPSTQRPVTLNVWEAVYFAHDAARLLDLAERAADLGVERFVLDDGWFGGRRHEKAGLGDWVVSPDVWPDGLHPLTDRVTELGMEFGLWFEPEMVNLDSDVARAHPEWIMQPAGRLPVSARFQHVLNLTIDAAWRHVFEAVDAVLTEYHVGYVKWDHNRDLVDAGTAGTGRPAVHAQTAAFYRLLDALRERHPDVEFESCSSGGARIDLEVMNRAERVWVSDTNDPEERQRLLLWTGQLLPAEFMGSHIASGRSHTTGRLHDLNFRAATAVFGHLGIEWDLAAASDEELSDLAWWIGWYKERRDTLMAGRQVRVDLAHPGCYLKGIVTDDRAVFSLSMLTTTPVANLGKLRFPGLDPDATYRVDVIDRQLVPPELRVPWSHRPLELTGRALAEAGLRAPLLQPATAVIFEFTRVRG